MERGWCSKGSVLAFVRICYSIYSLLLSIPATHIQQLWFSSRDWCCITQTIEVEPWTWLSVGLLEANRTEIKGQALHGDVLERQKCHAVDGHVVTLSALTKTKCWSARAILKALLHCAISSATCNATLRNVFVAVAKVRCCTMQRNLSNLQRFVPRKPGGTRYWSAGVGGRSDLQRNQRTLGDNCVARCWRGVTLCNGSCKLLRLLRKVELDSTSCNVARNKKDALRVAEVPCYTAQFFSNLQCNTVALPVAVKIAQCNRALTLSLPRVIKFKFLL